jgi:hypothetical protein
MEETTNKNNFEGDILNTDMDRDCKIKIRLKEISFSNDDRSDLHRTEASVLQGTFGF